jgi:hypothetical protein
MYARNAQFVRIVCALNNNLSNVWPSESLTRICFLINEKLIMCTSVKTILILITVAGKSDVTDGDFEI